MTNKDVFIQDIENAISNGYLLLKEESQKYFEDLKKNNYSKEMTENGLKIILFMKENYDNYNNIFKAKDIAEGLFMSPRSVSGSMRKLLTDGYCEKTGKDPVCYLLTDKGKIFSIDN